MIKMNVMENYYKILFPYAYNILGSVEEASDAVQDVLLKVTMKEIVPENKKNYLVRSVINQSINRKRTMQKTERLEELPHPVDTSYTDVSAELKDLVSFSMMILLEKLNPKERAVFILKEAFAYTHDEIADVLSLSVSNTRKILSRAKTKLGEKRGSVTSGHVSKTQLKRLEFFTNALHHGNVEQLHQLLHEDIEFRADGGKKIQVVEKYMSGLDNVTRLLLNVYERFHTSFRIQYKMINHQPGILYFEGNEIRVCQVFEIEPENNQISSIFTLLDPEILKHIHLKE